VVRTKFGLQRMVMVGDRGMITSARIDAVKELDDDIGWITALRACTAPQLDAGLVSRSFTDRLRPCAGTR
jgi:hypothetical protein